MQMIAKKVTYSYDCRAVGNRRGKGTFDHPDLNSFKKTGLKYSGETSCRCWLQVYWSTCFCFALFCCKGSQQETNRCPKEAIRGGNKLFGKEQNITCSGGKCSAPVLFQHLSK